MTPRDRTSDRTTAATAILREPTIDTSDARAFMVVSWGQGKESRGQVVPLPDGVEVTIGRQPGNTLTIEHDQVSRRHAAVVRRGADITVRDLGSRNGTAVNGVRIESATRVSAGDEIALGPVAAVIGVTSGLRDRPLVASLSDLEERLSAELDRAVRYRRPLGLVMLRLDCPTPGDAECIIDELAATLRRMDMVAQYGPSEYAVVLPEADSAATHAAALRLAAEARATSTRTGLSAVSLGTAVGPADATTAGELLSRARAALRLARTGGGDEGVAAAPAESAPAPDNVVVIDPLMKRVMAMTRKVANTPITVLVLGETGVGKEIVAGAIHSYSQRTSNPFVTLNCSALPESLLESELFGHERGAFTGADRRKTGYFEAARGGTIFLDEIGEMPLGVQAKLLRVLEQRIITRVGGTDPVAIDVRVVCATNRDLEAEIKRGRFRQDLFFRVSAFTLVVPPLRDRRSEISPLAQHFARHFAVELGSLPPTITAPATELLESYDWPGNVRELRNAIERSVVLARGTIDVEHLPERIGGPLRISAAQTARRAQRRAAPVDARDVASALESCGGNQTRAAKRLGISRWALIRLMQKHGLKKPADS